MTEAAMQVEQVLQKISFMEKDIELHKNILVSLKEHQNDEMEEVIRKIVEMKERVDELKKSIAEIDPDVHGQIMKLEEGTAKFKNTVEARNLHQVVTLDQAGECRIDLLDGRQFECLVKALDDAGNWIGLTHDGEVLEFAAEEVMEL